MLKAVPLDIPNVVDVYYGICSQATSYPGNEGIRACQYRTSQSAAVFV